MLGNSTVLTTEVASNGILYADVALDLSKVAVDRIPLMHVFNRLLLESGTSTLDRVQLTEEVLVASSMCECDTD